MKRGRGRDISEPSARGRQQTFPRPSCWGALLPTSQIPLSQSLQDENSPSARARRKPWRGGRRAGVGTQPPPQLPITNTWESLPEVSRKKYPALTASQSVPDILSGKVPSLFLATPQLLFLSWRNVSLPLLTQNHKHPETNFSFAFGMWIAEGLIMFKNLEGPVLPVCLFRGLTPPSSFCYVCQWKKLANPIYKYFCLLALCLMLYY